MTDVITSCKSDPTGWVGWEVDVVIDPAEHLVFHIQSVGPHHAYRAAIQRVGDYLYEERQRNATAYNSGWEDCMENYGLS
jgi:hypothetical protein